MNTVVPGSFVCAYVCVYVYVYVGTYAHRALSPVHVMLESPMQAKKMLKYLKLNMN